MSANIHILIDEEIKEIIEKNRRYRRESNNDILKRLLKLNSFVKKKYIDERRSKKK